MLSLGLSLIDIGYVADSMIELEFSSEPEATVLAAVPDETDALEADVIDFPGARP